LSELAPGVKAGSRQAKDTESDGGGHDLLGGRNGTQDCALGFAVGQTLGVEAEAGESHKQEGQPDDGKEEPVPEPKGEDLGLKFRMVQGEDIGGNDGTRPTTNPTDSRRAWDADMSEQIRVALVTNEVAHSVVIDPSTAGSRHAS
jgi:hypothetical protein